MIYAWLYMKISIMPNFSNTISYSDIPNPIQAFYRLFYATLKYYVKYFYIHVPSFSVLGYASLKTMKIDLGKKTIRAREKS